MQLYKVEGLVHLADVYGAGTFGGCEYNSTTACTDAAGTHSGGLANTGVMIAGVATLACLIALAAVLARVWRRPAKPVAQEVTADEENGESDTSGPSNDSPSSTDRQI